MVSSVDVFYFSLSIGFLVLVSFASYAMYQAAVTMKIIQRIAENIAETTQDINDLKNTIKNGILKFVFNLLSKKLKGGDF